MKKTIGILLFTALAFLAPKMETKAQPGNLDTVSVNLTMKGSEWAYYISYLNGTNDSTDLVFLRSVRDKLKTTPGLTWNTLVTMNNVKGKYILAVYEVGNRIPAGEAIVLGIAALNTIKAIPNNVLQYFIGSIDARHSNEYDRHRTLGKNMLID